MRYRSDSRDLAGRLRRKRSNSSHQARLTRLGQTAFGSEQRTTVTRLRALIAELTSRLIAAIAVGTVLLGVVVVLECIAAERFARGRWRTAVDLVPGLAGFLAVGRTLARPQLVEAAR